MKVEQIQLKMLEDSLRKEFKSEIENLEEELTKKFRKELESDLKELRSEVEDLTWRVRCLEESRNT